MHKYLTQVLSESLGWLLHPVGQSKHKGLAANLLCKKPEAVGSTASTNTNMPVHPASVVLLPAATDLLRPAPGGGRENFISERGGVEQAWHGWQCIQCKCVWTLLIYTLTAETEHRAKSTLMLFVDVVILEEECDVTFHVKHG